jgi:hypothetical protein
MMPVLLALVVSACNGGDGADTTVSAETAPTNPNAIRSDLPEDFPIPIPEGGEVQTAARLEEGDGFRYGALMSFEDGRYEEIVEFYDEWAETLPEEPERVVTTAERDGVTWTNRETGLLVTVSQAVDSVTLAVTAPAGSV